MRAFAAGCDLLKALRTSHEMHGSPIVSLACHSGGHQLLCLTKPSSSRAGQYKGSTRGSDLVVLDLKLLLVARRMVGARCMTAPIKFGVSPGEQEETPPVLAIGIHPHAGTQSSASLTR